MDTIQSRTITEFDFPSKANRTGYTELRKTSEGRDILRKRGHLSGTTAAQIRKASARKYGTFRAKEFVAWDGEGVTDKFGRHHYILLAASTGDYIQSPEGGYPTGLGTSDCLELLLDVAASNPGAYHVIYGGNYDANKILKDLAYSETRLRKLWDTCGVFYKHYHIEWVRGKWLSIKCLSTNRRIILYDVISFFQTSFVNTLEQWDIVVPHLEKMKTMKKARSNFKWSERKTILKYCQSELSALVKLMSKFRDNHIAAGLPSLSGLYGPGAIANGLLRQHGIKKYMLATDGEVNQASCCAYAAGRIERLLYGNYEGPVTIADVNSAYPYSISRLPSLVNGWRKVKCAENPLPYPMSLYHVKLFNHSKYASPLFYRKGTAKSRPIFFPNPKHDDYIETWIWTPEYENLYDLGFDFECREAFLFQGSLDIKPFAWLEELYYIRRAYKESGNPAEKNLKLAYNSLYGKFVQQAGYARDKEIPKWHQLEWGGYVTSETRAKLFRAIASIAFKNVVGMETDSIIIAGNGASKLDIPRSNQLGEWSTTTYEGITYIQSGVYWLKKDGEWLDRYSKRRGYLTGTLTRDAVLEAWNSNPYGDDTINDNGITRGMVVNARGNEFITLGHCFRPGQTLDEWGNWKEGPKKLSLWRGTKREIVREANPANQLLHTVDQTQFCGWSSPYSLEWGDDEST